MSNQSRTLPKTSLPLSLTGGKILLGCIATLQIHQPEASCDSFTRGILANLRTSLIKAFNIEKINSNTGETAHSVLSITDLAHGTMVKIVEMALEIEPDHVEKVYRETLLKTLREVRPVTRGIPRSARSIPLVEGDRQTTPPPETEVPQDTGLADQRFGPEDPINVFPEGRGERTPPYEPGDSSPGKL